MPPVNTGLLNGALAWRQHDGGHTDAPNWKYFIPWADKLLDYHPAPWQFPADQPVFRTDPNSLVAHSQLLAKATQGGIDVYFEGDSITRRWGATDYPELLANWKRNFYGWNAADFGWGADRTQNILWRLENGELDGVNPKVVVLLAGTNNVGDPSFQGDADAKAEDVTRGLEAIVRIIREKAPAATIVVMGIFPRNDNMALMPVIDRINGNLARFADGRTIRYLNINGKLAGDDGKLFEGMMNAQDKLHPTVKAYQVWADALKPRPHRVAGTSLRLGSCAAAHRGSRSTAMMALTNIIRRRTAALLGLVFISVSETRAADLPHFGAGNGAEQILVHGKPFLIRGGELGNSSAGTTAQADAILPAMARLQLNTVLVPVAWEQVEPKEGAFDFSILDHWIDVARSSISTWCCCGSEPGKTHEKDQEQQTVLMVQVENEMGYLGPGRDRSPEADREFDGPVPQELIGGLAARRRELSPELAAHFNPQGRAWRDVFGEASGEVFMA